MKRRTYLAAAASTVALAGCADSTSRRSNATGGGSDVDDTGDEIEPPGDDSRSLPDSAGTVDDFETLERWDVTGGTLEADPNYAVVGSQSARLEVGPSEQIARLARTFPEPRNLADVVPGVAVASDGLVVPWLRLVDADGDAIEYRRGVKPGLPLMRFNFGVSSIDESFDPESVRTVHLQVWTAEGERQTVWFDDLHCTPRPETGAVMIQFDDNHVTDYTKALPILEEYGYPAVTFVNPGRIEAETRGADDPGGFPRVDIDQLHELHDAGWTVANHCYDHRHLSELEPDEQEAQIARGKAWLESEGFDAGARYFAYPHGDYDATTIGLVDEYHEVGFAGGYPVQGYTTNHRLASRIGEPSAERVRTELERTAEMRGLTTMFFHRLEGDDLAAFETMVETIHAYESRGDLEVVLPADLEREFLFRW